MNLDRAVSLMAKLKIRDKRTNMIPLKLNACQLMIIERLKVLQQEKKPLWAIVLKSRRVGVSTLSEALLVLHCLSVPNARAMVIAHQYRSSKFLFGMAKLMRDSIPIKLPKGTQHLVEFPHKEGKSVIEVATAGSTSGGRGLTLSACHFSEAAFFPGDAESFTSLLPAIAYNEKSLVIIESTANGKIGDGQPFYEIWCDAVEGRNEFLPIFIPWTMDPECVRDDSEFDEPQDEEEKELLEDGITPGQLAWRRFSIATNCQGLVEVFHQEYPRTWQEAFISSGNPAFNRNELAYARSLIARPKAIVAFDRSSKGVSFTPARKGVHLWEKPQCGNEDKKSSHKTLNCPKCHHYYIGADVARGSDSGVKDDRYQGDFSSLVMWNGNTGRQAARFSERIGPEELADVLDMVGRVYNYAMINVELTGGFGNHTQKVLRDIFKYHNLYRWKGKDDKVAGMGGSRTSIGWETNYNTRRLMLQSFRESLRDKRLTIFDEALLAQLESASFTYSFGARWDVEEGHDDIMMAAMVGWIACEQYPPPTIDGLRSFNTLQGEEEEEPEHLVYKNDPRWILQRHWRQVRRPVSKMKDRLVGV